MRKQLLLSSVFLWTMLAALSVWAEALPTTVSAALKAAGIPESDVAIFVQPVDGGAPIINMNAEKSMNPASVMKLVTTNAALDLLKPVYRWKTEVYRSGEINGDALNGDLIIKGYGDPSFKEAEFRRLLVSLQQAGVREIKGDLVLDKSYFAKNIGNSQAFDNEIWRAYNATPSAFLVNGRNTSFKFSANAETVNITQEVELPEVKIANNMRLTDKVCGDWRSRMTYHVDPADASVMVTFSGVFSSDCGEKYLELSLFDDEKYAFFMFRKLWRQLGGGFSGRLRTQDEMPQSAVKLVEQVSEPLGSIVREVNKWSNNLMARQLLLTIAAEKNSLPASELKGMLAIKNWLASKGGGYDDFVIENGSGLSRIERISAASLGRMLISAFQSSTMPEFVASLPILSLDGTIQKRLNDTPVSARAHIKTGSINGVNALAGYVLDANNHRHVLVMLVNHVRAAASKNAQDALIQWVYQQP